MADELGFPVVIDDSDALDRLSALESKVSDLQNIAGDFAATAEKSFGDSAKSIDKSNKSMDAGEKKAGDFSATMADLGDEVKTTASQYNILGVNVGGLVRMFGNAKGKIVGYISVMRGATGATKAFKLALASTGIGLIVVAIGSLVTYLTRFQSGMDAVSKVTAAVGAVFDVFLDRIAYLGEALVALFSFDFVAAKEAATNAVKDLGKAEFAAANSAIALRQREIELEEKQIAFIERRAELEKEQAKLRLDAQDETLALSKRQEAAQKALDIENEILETEKAIAKENAEIAQGRADLAVNDREANRELAEAKAEVNRVEKQSYTRNRRFLMEKQRLEDEAAAAAKERAKEAQEVLDNYRDILDTIADKVQEIEIDKLSGVDRITAEAEIAKDAIAELEEKAREAAAKAGKEFTQAGNFTAIYAAIEEQAAQQIKEFQEKQRQETLKREEETQKLRAELITESVLPFLTAEEAKQLALLDVQRQTLRQELEGRRKHFEEMGTLNTEAAQAELEQTRLKLEAVGVEEEAVRAEIADRIKALNEQILDERETAIRNEEKLELQKVELLEESTDEQLTLEQFKEKRRLEIQAESLREQMAIAAERYGEDSFEYKTIALQVDLINKKIGEIGKDVDLNFLEKIKGDVAKALGATGEEVGAVIESIGMAYSSISEAITQATDLALEENQRYLDGLQERIEETESLLEEEQEKQKAGYANNVESKKKELEALKAEEAKAKKEQAELRKQQLKQQLIADALQQTSSLAVAAANVIAQAGTLGPIAGPILAAAAIATFYSMFKKYQAQSKQLAGQQEKLFKGGPVDQNLRGRTDRGSGSGHRVEDSNLVLGGEEYVLNGKTTRKNTPFIRDLNSGKYDDVNLQKIVGVGLNAGDRLPKIISIDAKQSNDIAERNREATVQKAETDRRIEKAMAKETAKLINYWKSEFPHYIPDGKGGYRKFAGKNEDKVTA